MTEPAKQRVAAQAEASSEDGLPLGWTTTSVEVLASNEPAAITDGPFGSNLKSDHYTEAGPRVIRLQNIGDGEFLDAKAHISEAHFESLRKHEACAGDIVIAMLGEVLPRACIVPAALGPAIVKADCVRLRVHARLALPAYVMAGLNSQALRQQAAELMHGVGRPRLGLAWFRGLRFPLAPLPEQQRVVEAIESYFTRLDSATATLERVERNLKRYRASVLKAAVQGRLVPTEAALAKQERRAYEPASVLLERILTERRRRWTESGKKGKYEEPAPPDVDSFPELPEGWCWSTVDAVGEVLLGRQRAPQYLTGEHFKPYLRVANVKDDALDLSDVEQMDFDPSHFEKYRLQPGDILVSEGQSPHLVGQSAIFHGEREDLCFQKTLHRFRPFSPGPSTEFSQIVFRAHVKSGVFKKLASITTNIAHLTLVKFQESRFPLPPEREQLRIVEECGRLMSQIDAEEALVHRQLQRCKQLRQSILKWAFEGKLADQDASDEPASVLLERIQAERAAAQTKLAAPKREPKRKQVRA